MGSRRKTLVAAAVPVGFLLSGALIWNASYAAFTSTTSNGTNNWSAGTVVISDDDSGSALFTPTNLVPGQTGNACIEVTYTGSATADSIVMDATVSGTNNLPDYLTMVVEAGTSCTGFVAASTPFPSGTMTALGAANPVHSWATRTTNTKVAYRITYTLSTSATNSQQAGTASMDVTWTASAGS